MKMTELRLGNLVIIHNQIVKMTDLHCDIFACRGLDNNEWICTERISEVQPIELTEEVLLKIGFDKHDEAMNIYAFENARAVVVYVPNRKLLRIEGVENDVLIDRNIRLNNVKYVHQLQNAYYLLTNEELKIDL